MKILLSNERKKTADLCHTGMKQLDAQRKAADPGAQTVSFCLCQILSLAKLTFIEQSAAAWSQGRTAHSL